MKKLRVGVYVLLLVFCLGLGEAIAQVVTANLQGTVTDPSGAAVAGATVTAKNVETGLTRATSTKDEGFYRFNLLPRGDTK